MFNIFGDKNQNDVDRSAVQTQTAVAPNTQITYDPELIDRLKNQHQELIALYTKIKEADESLDYDVVRSTLTEFKNLFHSHILLENVKLYIYLKHVFAADEDSSAIAMEMRKEMGSIGKVVNQFIQKYTAPVWTDVMKISFADELEIIGAALVDRINMEEESLYTLYYPPDMY